MPGELSEPYEGSDTMGFAMRAARAQQAVNDLGAGPDEVDFRQHVVVFDQDLNWSLEHTAECREHPTRTMSACPASVIMLATTMPPVQEPGRYRMRREGSNQLGGMPVVLFDKDENARPRGLMQRLEDVLTRFGDGQLVITSPADDDTPGPHLEWAVAIVMGREAEDSDMAGGAAYGLGPTMQAALEQALDQVGV